MVSSASDPATLVVAPRTVVGVLVGAVVILVGASSLGQVSRFFLGHDEVMGLVRLTYLNGEGTIPAWYSSSALLLCAVALALVGAIKRAEADRWTAYWFGLSLLFVYLSMDESAAIHEMWGKGIKQRFAPTGFLRFAWVIPGMAVVSAVSVIYVKFVWHLPRDTRRLFVLAAATFLGGALGLEMVGAKHLSVAGTHDFTHAMIITFEESAEMLGVVIFLHAILRYLTTHCGSVRLELRARPAPYALAGQAVARVPRPQPAEAFASEHTVAV